MDDRNMRANRDLPPDAPARRFLAAAGLGALAGVASFGLSILLMESYGGVLFVATPTVMGFVAGVFVTWRAPYRARSVLLAAVTTVGLVGSSLLAFGMEGLICLAMALPIAIPGALVGGLFALLVTRRRLWPHRALALLVVLMPTLLGAEAAFVRYPVLPRVSEIEIDAPPSEVWKHVIGFADLPQPTDLIFKTGIAYPVRARLDGEGVGAIRYCEFSTGAFVEPITVWEPGRRLAFDVTEQPEPMHELSPHPRVYAPHLLDGLQSRRGEFLLMPLPGGRTRLRGTTWYQVNMGPQWYWRSWSDFLIGRIHRRVLRHIKDLAETDSVRLGSD